MHKDDEEKIYYYFNHFSTLEEMKFGVKVFINSDNIHKHESIYNSYFITNIEKAHPVPSPELGGAVCHGVLLIV